VVSAKGANSPTGLFCKLTVSGASNLTRAAGLSEIVRSRVRSRRFFYLFVAGEVAGSPEFALLTLDPHTNGAFKIENLRRWAHLWVVRCILRQPREFGLSFSLEFVVSEKTAISRYCLPRWEEAVITPFHKRPPDRSSDCRTPAKKKGPLSMDLGVENLPGSFLFWEKNGSAVVPLR